MLLSRLPVSDQEDLPMGGLFSAPSPPPMPEPEPIPDPGLEDEKRRREMIQRKRRGRRRTYTTSPPGFLHPHAGPPALAGRLAS